MAKRSRLNKNNAAAAIFLACLLALAAMAAVCVSVIISREAAAASFGVGVVISSVTIDQSSPLQNATPIANGTNVSVSLPVTYKGTGLQNITITLLSLWKKITNIKINESGLIKNATIAGGQFTWEANRSATNGSMLFDAAPPAITKTSRFLNSTFYQQNLTIESDNAFINASANVTVNSTFSFYTLYWFNGSDYADKTAGFNLNVSNGAAMFDSFQTLTVSLFMLEGSLSCSETWSCSGWSDSRQCGTRVCTDASNCRTNNGKPSESGACPESGAGTGGGGGGGGGGGTSGAIAEGKPKGAEQPLSVDREIIRISVRPGEFKKESITVKNTGSMRLSLNVETEGISPIALLDTSYFELEPGASRAIGMLVLVGKEEEPRIYSGKVRIYGDGAEKAVNVIINVLPVQNLFDVMVTVNPRTKAILPLESVIAEIKLFNLLGFGRHDVVLSYGAKDDSDNVVISEQKTVAVETSASVTSFLEMPRNSKAGTYTFFAIASVNDTVVGVGSDTFEVLSYLGLGKRGLPLTDGIFLAIIAMIAINLLILLLALLSIVLRHFSHRHAAGQAEFKAPYASGLSPKEVSHEEIERMPKPAKKVELNIQKGDIVEIISGAAFKHSKAKVKRIDKTKEEVVVELLESAVQIPIILKLDALKLIRRESEEGEEAGQHQKEVERRLKELKELKGGFSSWPGKRRGTHRKKSQN